jgi:VWFA-related protein
LGIGSWELFSRLTAVLVLLAMTAAVHVATPHAQRARTIQVTVVGDRASPVEGLSAADFTIKEDGKTRTVLEATPSSGLASVALLIDDRGSDINEIRAALAAFAGRVQDRAEVSLVSVVPTTVKVFDYTASGPMMLAGIRRLVWRAGPAGGLLLGAIADAANELGQREAARPSIVVLTFEGPEFKSHRRADVVLAALERSRAVLHVVSVGKPNLRRMNRAAVESGDAQGDEWTVDENNRNAVLGEGPRQSGGRRHELTVATGLTPALELVAADVINQYTIVFEGASGTTASRRLDVSVKRRGVTIRAPRKISG